MVIRTLGSSSSYGRDGSSSPSVAQVPDPNPDPKKFIIKYSQVIGKFLVVRLRYRDCPNYEGNKVMVYDDVLDLAALINFGLKHGLDPHFGNSPGYHYPIARFEPTARGWQMALKFATMLNAGDIEDILSKDMGLQNKNT